ncbi:MAG TPA: hypothetical protein VMM38_06840 [Aridibacter sp.]|nr:hypothetical protein [Aridibacter sp.]
MLEGLIWDWLEDADEANTAQMTRAWLWVRATYKADLEVHAGNKIFHMPIVTFSETERLDAQPFKRIRGNHSLSLDRINFRKALSICDDPNGAAAFTNLRNSGSVVSWVTATLRKRQTGEIAWMLGIRDAAFAETVNGRGPLGEMYHILLCKQINEMMPKKLVPFPDALQG